MDNPKIKLMTQILFVVRVRNPNMTKLIVYKVAMYQHRTHIYSLQYLRDDK